MGELLSVFIYSVKHIFMPGEATPILITLGLTGTRKNILLKMALGMGLSNGGIMILALLIGLFAQDKITPYINELAPLIRIALAVVFILMAFYLAWKAMRAGENKTTEEVKINGVKKDIIEKKPFITGFLMGTIPSSSDLGFIAIAPILLLKRGTEGLGFTILTVWLGVILSYSAVSFVVTLIPVDRLRSRYKNMDKFLLWTSAILLVVIAVWLIYEVWYDYYSF